MHVCVSLTLDQKVLLGGEDSLLGLVVGELSGAQVGGCAALSEQHGGLGGGMRAESRSVKTNIELTSTLDKLL